MKYFVTVLCLVVAFSAFGAPKKKVVYKKYEKFDFDVLGIEGESGSPGDISVMTRYNRRFRNKLPYRKHFKWEMRKAIQAVR